MEKPYLLHMLTPTHNVSPFDVNMAYDAGFDAVIPYGDVMPEQVTGLTQDAIFSRGPKGVKRTGLFIGGRDPGLALDMLELAKAAMVPPFEVSVFADPSGSFTTAAALVAKVEQRVKERGASLEGLEVVVFGGTGPVGMIAAVLCAQAGASVRLTSHDNLVRAQMVADACNKRHGTGIAGACARAPEEKAELVAQAQAALCCARAGVQVLSSQQLAGAARLLVAADVNAVPPAGIEGVGAMDDGKVLDCGAAAIGALAVGNVKYQVQRGLFESMRQAEGPRYLDFRDAFDAARRHVA